MTFREIPNLLEKSISGTLLVFFSSPLGVLSSGGLSNQYYIFIGGMTAIVGFAAAVILLGPHATVVLDTFTDSKFTLLFYFSLGTILVYRVFTLYTGPLNQLWTTVLSFLIVVCILLLDTGGKLENPEYIESINNQN